MADSTPVYIDQLRKNWVIIAFIAGCIVGWTNLTNKLDDHQTRITKLETQYEQINSSVIDINQNITKINANIEFIKQKLNQ